MSVVVIMILIFANYLVIIMLINFTFNFTIKLIIMVIVNFIINHLACLYLRMYNLLHRYLNFVYFTFYNKEK